MGIAKDFRNFYCFYHEKVDFPASKVTSECFLYLPNLSKGAKQSLEILLHTHKIFFGHLDRVLETIKKALKKAI